MGRSSPRGESIAEHVDEVRAELGVLESALQLEAA